MRALRHLHLLALLGLLLWSATADARRFLDSIGDADRSIQDDLYNGRIVEAYPFGANENTGHLWKVKIEHNGNIRWAIFKPREYGDRDGWDRTPMEVAVYKLNRILGMDLVPPSAYRKFMWIGGNYYSEGALILFTEDGHNPFDVRDQEWKPGREAFSSDVRVLQSIARDADNQNGKNIMRGKHWKDGKYRVMKIDNAACMRNGTTVNLDHAHPEWGAVTRFNKATYDHLKELNFADLKADVGDFMSDDEIRQWLGSRDGLVGEIDRRRAAQGDSIWFTQNEIAFDARRKVGKDASAQQVSKFENLLRKKGVKVEYLAAKDPALKGAVGRTVLDKDRIVVRLALSAKGAPNAGALVEELVHVNQLQKMAKGTGGLRALYASLQGKSRSVRATKASMEEYAKSKVALIARGKDLQKVKADQATYHTRAVRAVKTGGDTRSLWRK
jgi:hypothetical protein